jgi:multidrug efflux pump subunit AcrA (membrane-fusion protein)
VVLLGLLVVGGLLALEVAPRRQHSAELSARQHEVEEGTVPVTVIRPEQAPASTEIVLPGNIQAIEETALYARVNGYLHERLVDIGARVRAGQVLAVIETPDLDQELAQARAVLSQAEVGVTQAHAKLEQARATHQQTRASLQQARANLALARVAKDRWNALVEQQMVSRQEADEKRTADAVGQVSMAAAEATVAVTSANVHVGETDVAAARANVAAQQANVRSCPCRLRIIFQALSRSVCLMCNSRSSARQACFQGPVHPSWGCIRAHFSCSPPRASPTPYFRPSASVATGAL